jgi:hypothetical protein
MDKRKSRYLGAVATVVGLVVVATTPGARAHGLPGRPIEITGTARGHELVRHAAQQFAAQGASADVRSLHAWEVAPGEHIVGRVLPANFSSSVTTDGDGRTRIELRFDVTAATEADSGRVAASGVAVTPSWVQIGGECFNWIRNFAGELLPCYKLRKLVGEAFPRDYYGLEQYGTVQATPYGKIYDGWVAAVRAPVSATMRWEDWDPLGDLVTNTCMIQPLSISILGTGFSTSGLLCERWDMTLYNDAGHFKQMWSCGCLWPFGQPYPNSRGMRYVQGISVPGGGSPWWTLTAGFTAV